MDFFDNIGMTFNSMRKISGVCLCYQIVCLFRFDMIFVEVRLMKTAYQLSSLSKQMHSQSPDKNAVVKTRLEFHRPL